MAEIKTERLDGYRRLVEITRDLASTLDLDVLLERIVTAAAEVSGSESASILLYDNLTRQLYFQVATNLDEPTMRGLVVPLEGSIAGWVVVNRKSVRLANVQEDPRFFGHVDQMTGRPYTVADRRAADHQEQGGRCTGGAQQGARQVHGGR